jgi:hypothetical protein
MGILLVISLSSVECGRCEDEAGSLEVLELSQQRREALSIRD